MNPGREAIPFQAAMAALAVAIAKGTAFHVGHLGVDDARGLPTASDDLMR